MKHIIRQNIIKNCPVSIEDINIAHDIFGDDIGTLKGKSVRRPSPIIKNDNIEIPPEIKQQHKQIDLHIDIMYVNSLPMLTGINDPIMHRSLIPLENRTETEIYHALDVILRFVNDAGHYVKVINCDGEFKPLMDKVADELYVRMNYTTMGEHVPKAERNNRTIKERIRAAYHNLPYKHLPKVMWRKLAMLCTDQLNYFPAKGGVSAYFSPYTLMTGKQLDYNKHCQIPFGQYVQANDEPNPTNTNAPRTLDCIYLRPTNNIQGGHELMDLATGRVIT